VPTIVVVGRGLADGVVEVWDRASGERVPTPVGEVVDRVAETVEAERA
jgi:prolyl-tRNA synthetase